MTHSQRIAVIAPRLDMHYYYVGILAGIHEAARASGVQVLAIRANRPRDIALPSLGADQVAGWIAVMSGDGLEEIARSTPLVTIGGAALPSLGRPAVMPDNAGGTAALVSHLIAHGHRRIAFVGYLENPDIRQRYAGYLRALQRHGLPLDPRLVYACPQDGFGKSDGAYAVQRMIAGGISCTALVAGTDLSAIGAMEALAAAGLRVPDDVAVVGFDDLYLAHYTTPSLTTVRHPFEELGRTACRLLLDQIAGRVVPTEITYVGTEPILRRSCGCQPALDRAERVAAAPTGWSAQLATELLAATREYAGDASWRGAAVLAAGVAAAVEGRDGPPAVAVEQAWQELVAQTVDLETLQALHAQLERAGAARIAQPGPPPSAAAQLQAFLSRSYVEMLRAYRASTIGRTSQIQRLIETNYEISTEISLWHGLGTGLGQRLAWLRHTPARWGCLARWHDQSAGRAGTLEITDTYARDGAPLLPAGTTYRAAEFPPAALLDHGATPAAPELRAVVPFQTPAGAWWVLTVCQPLETEFLTDRENLGMWATLLGASLEREALTVSLTEQQERLRIANRELQLAKEAAERADALKTRLLANVSHELRTPLDAILGYSAAALRSPGPYADLPAALRQDLGQITQNSQHLLRLINDLLDLSRAEVDALELFPERFDPRVLLAEAFASFARQPDRAETVAWRLQLPAELPALHADPVRVRQILLNLLSNAQKWTVDGQIVLGAAAMPPYLHIWVADSGAGIPPELQSRIFEPFGTSHDPQRRSTGIGLGLSITRRLVALHEGLLTLDSRPGAGTTMHVYLPLPGQVAPAPRIAATAEHVLLVIAPETPISPAVADLSARMRLPIRQVARVDDLEALLATAQPVAVVWERADTGWELVQRVRTHPQLCHLPLTLLGDAGPRAAVGLTNLVLKPASPALLEGVIQQLVAPATPGPILIVDDDPQARQLYERIVSVALPDHPIMLAADGRAALELVAATIPTLVILDLVMPEVDGFGVLERLRSDPRTHAVPVLVMSGQVLTEAETSRLAHGRVTFQSKGTLSADETAAVVRHVLDGEALPPATSLLVKRTLAYIHQHYMRPLARDEIAAAVGVSAHYLTRIFREEQGLSPWEYLNRYRVRQAKQLLLTTDAPIAAIADQVGFADLTYFGRVFQKHAGRSPREYRLNPS